MMRFLLPVILLFAFAPGWAADTKLEWTHPENTHSGFKLRYRMEADTQYTDVDVAIAPTVRQYTHVGAPDGQRLYKLTAFTAVGESAASFVWTVNDVEPPPPPGAPKVTTVTVTVAAP